MPRLALVLMLGVVMLGLTACAQSDSGPSAGAADLQAWRFATGKPPTRAEYTAIVAACQDGAVRRSRTGPLDACLADLGLKPAP